MIAWFDGRARPQAERLGRLVGQDRLFGLTGLSLQPIFGLCKLLWLKENEPDAYSRTATWLNVADYMAFRLCGVAATDYSLASRTLALDLHRPAMGRGVARGGGHPPRSLRAPARERLAPRPGGSRGRLGRRVCPRVPASRRGATTTSAAPWPSASRRRARCSTRSAPRRRSSCPSNARSPTPRSGTKATPRARTWPAEYYVFGGQYTSGASVEWLREVLGGVDYDTLIAEAEEVPPGSLGAFFLPHLRLANPPYDDPAARGAFVGLSTDVKRGELFRAVLEGLAYDSRNSLEPLLAHAGLEELRAIHAIGGGTQNRLLMRIKATVLDQRITVSGVEEATSLGAAILGGVGAGVYADVPSALEELQLRRRAPSSRSRTRCPSTTPAFRRVYGRIYPSLRGVHHEIEDLHG